MWNQAANVGIEYFYMLTGLLFKWTPVANDYIISNFIAPQWVSTYNVVSLFVVCTILIWFLRMAANKILIIVILLIVGPFFISSANNLFSGVPAVASITSKLDGIVRGISNTSSGTTNTVNTQK